MSAVMVCSACGEEACAMGDLMCEEARDASIIPAREYHARKQAEEEAEYERRQLQTRASS